MAARSNAASELTRLWLEYRHGCLFRESVQVPVKGNYSDIDFLVIQGRLTKLRLPNGVEIGPRVAVEAKDEHDGVSARDFAKLLIADLGKLNSNGVVERHTSGIKFTMLKEEHFEVSRAFFGTDDFDRLVVGHAFDFGEQGESAVELGRHHRINWLTIPEVVLDFYQWYEKADKPVKVSLRNMLTGDIFHLLVGFCGFCPR
jgi:hypothetical protein